MQDPGGMLCNPAPAIHSLTSVDGSEFLRMICFRRTESD
jgi:hypothetical protein